MIILPILEIIFYTNYITPVFLVLFSFGLLFKLIGR